MTPDCFTLDVAGTPAPQGSKTAVTTGGRVRLIEAGSTAGRVRHRAWRAAVYREAVYRSAQIGQTEPMDGPLSVHAVFRFERPKSVPRRHRWKPTRPDLDKLARSTLDSLTDARVISDDSRIVKLSAWKTYAEPGEEPGVSLIVERIKDDCGNPVE
jgi:Holliday junction resolvase RusA-like endonuclease